MLTLFLLVVLGGGAGLLAVSLVDSDGLSRLRSRLEVASLRRPRRPHTTTTAAPEPAATAPSNGSPARPVVDDPRAGVVVARGAEPARPRARTRPGNVPRSRTAIEGSYQEVGRASYGRRLVSLVSLLVVVGALGVGIAALAGATVGAAAELVDRAIE